MKSPSYIFYTVTLLAFLTFIAYDITFSDQKIITEPPAIIQKSVEGDREQLSLNSTVGNYNLNNCTDIKHTDDTPIKVCISKIEGVANGFYNHDKSLIVIESLNVYTLVHELVHAATVHNSTQINDDIKNVTDPQFQERIAYDVEYMLKQVLNNTAKN